MLYDINGKRKETIPHWPDYRRWRVQLSDNDHEKIMTDLHQKMDKEIEEGRISGKGAYFKSGFLPGSEWEGTPYLPIWEACGHNEETAGLFFGLLVWEAVMTHNADWCCMREESPGDRPTGMTYFEKRR